MGVIVEQIGDGGDDGVGLGADQAGIAAVDRLGPLAIVAQDEQGQAERGAFLLQPAAVAEHQIGPT